MMTTIEVYQKAAEFGLSLVADKENVLTVRPANRCPPEFVETLRAHKWHLLSMLSWPFVMVESKALGGDRVFFCENEQTKAALVEAGTLALSIYTKEELRILCDRNRIKPFTDAELRKVHEIRKNFRARITPKPAP
jgi:hypothetical protein